MTDLDRLFTAPPSTKQIPGTTPIRLNSTESHNRTDFVTDAGFLDAFYRGDFTYCVRDYFHYKAETRYNIDSISFFLPPFEIIRAVESKSRLELLTKGLDWWAAISILDSAVTVEFGVQSLERGRELAQRFNRILARGCEPEAKVSFQIWTDTDELPSTKSFSDVSWEKIQPNYPDSTRKNLDALARFSRTRSSADGRIILFHGPPGTGKTYAVRAMLTAWKHWASAALVLDPEVMLASPSYLLKIMERDPKTSTRLLVFEDADEIVEKNGTRGSGLSRLLNLTDGLIGATQDLVVLLTTNASPGALDTALTRPGRCLATVGFDQFPTSEANERLGTFGPAKRPMTLAEIYRQLGETTLLASELPVMTGQYL
jgi:energy-coupling factor transporter ATP-binding protein EcfA2